MKSIHICNNCGTVSIAGNDKCPNCGADEQTGWDQINIHDTKTRDIKTRVKGITSFVFQAWRRYWKPIIAVITIAALLSYILSFALCLLILALTAAAMIAYRWLYSRRNFRSKRLYEKLLKKARGDRDLVSRMIEFEHRRNPDADINEWLEDALIRWERDLK